MYIYIYIIYIYVYMYIYNAEPKVVGMRQQIRPRYRPEKGDYGKRKNTLGD